MKILAVKRPRIIGIAVLALFAVLVLAWVDGGEEAIHTINQPLELSEIEQ